MTEAARIKAAIDHCAARRDGRGRWRAARSLEQWLTVAHGSRVIAKAQAEAAERIGAWLAKPRHPRKPPVPSEAYAPGFFTELVHQHRWPPRFVSRAWGGVEKVTPAPHRHGGFDKNPLGLPGAAPYIRMFEAQAAQAIKRAKA